MRKLIQTSLAVLLLTIVAIQGKAVADKPVSHHFAENKYPVAAIPAPLLEKANAVLRRHETVYTVNSISEANKKVFYAITILNEKGKEHAALYVPYNKLHKVNYIHGAVYDAQGNLLDKLSKSDIKDASSFDGFSLVSDNRYKSAQFNRNQYPYTVEFEYEITNNNLLGYPIWYPQDELDMSVERANFQVVMPKNLKLRYKEVNITKPLTITEEDNRQIYNWEITGVKTTEREVLGPPERALVPVVYTAPSQFEVEGYSGDMSSWKSYGEWQNKLNAGREQLPEELKQKIVQLTAGEKDPVKKVKKVYEYLQQTTRYVGIQLGIGGWQPFDATTVNRTSYGDCKALSNYTKAMLQAIGIESFYTIILAGEDEDDIDTKFPSAHFNHVTLFVPLQKDTIWLECTDQTKAFGYAGSFTGNRHALAITPEGGKIVRTPVYKASDNLEMRTADVYIDAQGDATAEVKGTYTGLQQDDISAYVIDQMSPEEQKKWLYKSIGIPNFDINKFEFIQKKDRIPSVTEKLQLSVRKWASKSGKRVFLPLNLLSVWGDVPARNDNRRTDLVLKMPFIDSDTVRYHLPEGYQVESQPENIAFQSAFGSYSVTVKIEQGVVTYIRRQEMKQGRYPNTVFNEFADFCKKMNKADRMQLVLLTSNLAEK
jgi:hypothetical protein